MRVGFWKIFAVTSAILSKIGKDFPRRLALCGFWAVEILFGW